MSGMSGCLAMPWATSTRKPSTPRSSQKRRIESNSSRTSWLVQLRSGCSGANRCRYHWPGEPSASMTRCHAGPPKTLCQSLGGSVLSAPRPSRKTYRARSGLWGGAARAAANQGCWSEVWFGTRSTMTLIPRAWVSPDEVVEVGEGAEHGVDAAVVGNVVAGVGLGRGVERVQPDGVDAKVVDVRQAGADAGQVAHPVAVGVGEAADVDLVDHGAPPPRTVSHGAGYPAGKPTGAGPWTELPPSSTLMR